MLLKRTFVLFAVFGVITAVFFAHAQQAVTTIPKDELKQKLTNPDVIVLDSRTDRDWESSNWKIQGALRAEPSKVDSWKDRYPKNKTLVIYCA